MKVTIKNDTKSSEIKYPCLMVSYDDHLYYMITPRIGFCITDQTWSEDHDQEGFTPFTGTVELSND